MSRKCILIPAFILAAVLTASQLISENLCLRGGEIRELENSGLLIKQRYGVWKTRGGLLLSGRDKDGSTRLEHVMKHSRDNRRKAVHGVFTITKTGIITLMDRVWSMYRKGSLALRKNGSRSVIQYDTGERIGFSGGRRSKGRTMEYLTKVRLVLNGKGPGVVAFYPVR